MHVGVDATCWQNTRGYGRHARALLGALVNLDSETEYTFFTDSPQGLASLPDRAKVQTVPCGRPTDRAASANGNRQLRDMWKMGRAMADPTLDILLFPTIYSFVPVFSRAKKVVVIHDIIAETFPHLTLPRRSARLFWRLKTAVGRWQASALVTVSEHSRGGIIQRFHVAPDQVFVVGEASDKMFRSLDDPRPTPRLKEVGVDASTRQIVYVGGFGPHKNLTTLIDAFADLAIRDEFMDVRLVMVGEYQKETFYTEITEIRRRIGDLGLADRVVFTGFLSDEDLVVLLNRSTVLVLPSLLEGFGLPAVEAAACGLPVIATTASPLPELLGEGGLFVDPLDRDGWRNAMVRVLGSDDLRRQMRAKGMEAAQRLTWDQAARQMMGVLRKVAAR